MKIKRIAAVILALSLGMTTLTGCGKTEEQASADGSAQSQADASTDAAADTGSGEKIKLTAIITKHPLTKELAQMEWLQAAEERAGVEIEWQEVTADWPQKKGTLLASGDIPDLIIGNNSITDPEFAQFQGLFQDLTDLIATNGPNVQAMFDAKPETKVIATQLDGKIYGLPKYQRFWPEAVTRQFINQKWLDNLGLEMPTNWDELYDVLVAFKEQDANGNGDPNDEIPMDFAPTGTTGLGVFQPQVLLGSLGITLTDTSGQGYFVEDGVVKNFFVDERYKTVMKFLNKCYSAGLINTEVFTQDYTKYQSVARGNGDVAAVGYTYGWDVTDRFGNELAAQYASIAPLKYAADADYDISWDYSYNMLNYGINSVQMSAACENKEAAMRFINELYDPQVSMQVLFGSIETNIKDNGDGTYAVLPPTDPAMDPGTWKWTSSWADNGPMYIADSLELTLGTDMQAIDAQTAPLSEAMGKVDLEKNVLPSMFMKYTTEDNTQLGLNNTNLMTLCVAMWSQWMTTGGIDEQWDDYVKNCESAGLNQNLEIMQKYYDAYMSAQ